MKNLLAFIFSIIILNNYAAQTTPLYGDVNSDGCVDLNDLLDVISTYGQCLPTISCGDIISHEGYDYSTVQIGSQCWFVENCRYLPSVSPSTETSEINPYYYVYGYEGSDIVIAETTFNYATYGVLYNFAATITPGLCPSGWHVPSDEEWISLSDFLGGGLIAGDAMKSSTGWDFGGNGSNTSGFSALPGGYLSPFGDFIGSGFQGYWWSNTSVLNSSNAWYRFIRSDAVDLTRNQLNRKYGFSVRCLMD